MKQMVAVLKPNAGLSTH